MGKPAETPMSFIQLFQIYDLVGEQIIGPIIAYRHPAAAIRSFTDLLRDPKTTLGQHPDDYDIRLVGVQDENDGTIDPVNPPIIQLTGTTWRMMNEQREGGTGTT